MSSNITAKELYERVNDMLKLWESAPIAANKLMHETLVIVCAEGLKDSRHAYGDLNSQVETLIRQLNIAPNDASDIRQMRRHSNKSVPLEWDDLRYDARVLSTFIGRVLRADVPDELNKSLPHHRKAAKEVLRVNTPDKRAIVKTWDEDRIHVVIDQEGGDEEMVVYYTKESQFARMEYLYPILREGMQLNLLGCEQKDNTLTPRLIIVEPDCLLDISTIAGCFEDYGHHPLLYLVSRLSGWVNNQAILLGNFAGGALDDIINDPDYSVGKALNKSFKKKAVEYSTCQPFDGNTFKQDAATQAANLQQVVNELKKHFDMDNAILEPSFVCEKLGIQGRVDLMTTDLKLLVEQKSGRNIFLERNIPNNHGAKVVEKHYVQLLLYYGILFYNFHSSKTDIRLLYSKYQLPQGLISVANLMQLVYEAMQFRNEAVALEFEIAHRGPAHLLPLLNVDHLNTEAKSDFFYLKYLRPPLEAVLSPLEEMSQLETSYFCRMLQFSVRENLMSKIGVVEGSGNSIANLWSMPLLEKKETGNIYTGLTIVDKQKGNADQDDNGYDLIILSVPNQGEEFLPNFRRGDMVYLYAYPQDQEPDVRKALLFKGALAEIQSDKITVRLADGQQNPNVFDSLPYDNIRLSNASGARPEQHFKWCIEHGGSDVGGSAAIHSIYELITAPEKRKALLLGQRAPQCDKTQTLSRSYDPELDPLLLRAKQARDYFLVVGPPGTGKTSRALRYLVEEELTNPDAALLLSAYTNRAVDEICGMLVDAGIDFIRLGNDLSCAKAYEPYLISKVIGRHPKLHEMKQKLLNTKVFVATTSTLQAKPFVFDLKHFSLAIIDESSQILEPSIIGLLAGHAAGVNIDRFILIGDHKQLPAVVQQSDKDAAVDEPQLQAIGLYNCKNSLFERLIKLEQNHHRTDFIGTLRRQGRMHPEIAEFPGDAFYTEERLQPVPLAHQLEERLNYALPAEDHIDELLKNHRLLFFESKDCRQPDLSDKVNADEARIVADVLRRIHRFYADQFDPDKTVGVIVPYRNQIAMIRREIDKLGIPALQSISIDTVERYQGSQRDVIIYSFTIQQRYQLDFLTANTFMENNRLIDRKLNVALTRARRQLILTGNAKTLSHAPVFARLMDYIKSKHCWTKL